MFWKCSSLSEIPDISKWNVPKVQKINGIFKECLSLSELPDISKWNVNKSEIKNLFTESINLSKVSSELKYLDNNIY